MMNMACFFRRIVKDERGVSALELGLASPVLLLIAVGLVDFGHAYGESYRLQQAVNRGLEIVQARPLTSDDNAADVDYTHIRREAAEAAGVAIDRVTLERWLECDNARKDDYADECQSDEETSRFLSVTVSKSHNGQLLIGNKILRAAGFVRIQ